MTNLEAISSPNTFSTEMMLIFKKSLKLAKAEATNMDDDSLPEIENSQLQQSVMLSVNSFGETKWIGPVKIVQILLH